MPRLGISIIMITTRKEATDPRAVPSMHGRGEGERERERCQFRK